MPVDLRSVGTAFGASFGIGFGSSDELPSEEDKVSVSSSSILLQVWRTSV